MTKDEQLVEQVKKDFRRASLSGKDRSMLEYVVRLSLEPWNMEPGDVDNLRAVGFADADIVHINQIAGFYGFVNRQILGLGIELEPRGGGSPP